MIFLLILLFLVNSYCEKIHLKDGTVIYGSFEGEIDNYFIIRTKYGVLSVPKFDVLTPSDLPKEELFESSNLKISVEKSSDTFIRRFYDGNKMIGEQILSRDGVIISSTGYIKDGIYYEYDSRGNIMSERIIKNGLENGPLIEFYEDGKVKSRIDYRDGKIHGKAIFYSKESKPILEQTYSNGILDGFTIEYDINGNIKDKILYISGKNAGRQNEEKIALTMVSFSTKTENVKTQSVESRIEDSKTIQPLQTDISYRLVKIARGIKVFVNVKSRYSGSFIYDNGYNIIDITGKIPDGKIEIADSNKKIIFEFSSNWPVSCVVFEDGVEKKRFIYDENGKAIEKK